MPDMSLAIAVYVLLCLQMAGLGAGVLNRTGLWTSAPATLVNGWTRAALAMGVGLGLDAMLLFALGLTGTLTPAWVLSIGGTLTLLSVVACRPRWPGPLAGNARVLLLAIALLFVAFGLFAIRVPGFWDDTMYHLPLARQYGVDHRLTLAPFLRFPLFPQYMDLMLTLGLMLGGQAGDLLAQGLATLPLFIVSLGLIGLSVHDCDDALPGFIAVLVLLLLRPVRDTLGYAYIDNGLILFCWGCVLACRAVLEGRGRGRAPDLRWVVLAGFFAGLALGTKYFGAVFAAIVGLWLLLATRHVRSVLLFGLSAALVGGGWYLRAYLISGDPVHPAGGGVFGYFLWNASDLAAQHLEQARHGVPKQLANMPLAFREAGIRVLLLAPLALVFWRRMSSGGRFMLALCLSYFVFWFYVTQVDRYIAPVAAPAAFLVAWSLAQVWQSSLGRLCKGRHVAIWSALLCLLLVLNPFYKGVSQAMEQGRHWQAQLEARPGYVVFERANQLQPQAGARLVNVGFENAVYFFHGVVIGDVFGPGRYAQMVNCAQGRCRLIPATQMQALMSRFDARLLAVSTMQYDLDMRDYSRVFEVVGHGEQGLLLRLRQPAG